MWFIDAADAARSPTMALTKKLGALLKKVGSDGYGPGKTNPIYAVTDKSGATYTVRRHQWALPVSRWAWTAKAEGVAPKYGDTLVELMTEIGFDYEEVE